MFDVSAALTLSLSTLKYLRGLEYLFDTVDIVSGQQVQFEGRLLEISNLPPKYLNIRWPPPPWPRLSEFGGFAFVHSTKLPECGGASRLCLVLALSTLRS